MAEQTNSGGGDCMHIHLHRRGNSFAHLLTILFIGLKLSHHIDWNWVLVLCPLAVHWSVGAISDDFVKWANTRARS